MRIMTLHPSLLPLLMLDVLQLAFISRIVSIEYVVFATRALILTRLLGFNKFILIPAVRYHIHLLCLFRTLTTTFP